MLDTIKEKVHKITKVAGLEVTLLPDNVYRIFLTVLVLDKKSIRLERKEHIAQGTIEAAMHQLGKEIPVYLVLNGRGILHKKISESGTDSNVLIQSVLPNAKAADFYIQNIVSEKSSMLSIVRKEIADPILNSIQESGHYCVGLSLGGMVISSVLPLISSENTNTSFTGTEHCLTVDSSGIITDYASSGFTSVSEKKYFQLDTEKLEEEYLVSYAAAFGVLTGQEPVLPFAEKVNTYKEEFLNKQLFKKLSWGILGLFFLILMINFMLFASYSSQNNTLVQKESKYSSMFSEMESLSKEVKEKESFLSQAGWLQSSSMSYYADRIAATVPGSVKLTELSINPLDERKSKEEKKELFTSGVIVLKGECSRPTELNEWLDKIKSTNKITKARLVNYAFDNKENKGSFNIEIEIEN